MTATFSTYHLTHFSEQTALACFFSNVSQTLPCGYLYDTDLPRHVIGQPMHTACMRWSGLSMKKACFIVPRSKCMKPYWSPRAACDAISDHVREAECQWLDDGPH